MPTETVELHLQSKQLSVPIYYCRYDEVKDYNFGRGGWQSGTGHFTQVVWKSSKELGLGRAKTSDGKLTYVVARYRPAGNIINFMAENVFPKGGN